MADDFATVTVEVLFSEGPGTADGAWTDITRYVTAGRCRRGRQYELDQFQAGTLSLTLKAKTRLFDPENAAGAYYGMLTPMRQIRVQAAWPPASGILGTSPLLLEPGDGAVGYPIWRGYVTSWGSTTWQDRAFETTIDALDGFVRFDKLELPSSAWALEIQQDDPDMWLRLGETNTARLTDSSPGGNYGTYDNCVQGAQGLVVNDADGAAQFAHSLEERIVVQNPDLITGYPFTITGMFQIDGSEPDGLKFLFVTAVHVVSGLSVAVDATGNTHGSGLPTIPGQLYVSINDGTNSSALASATIVADDRPHHFAWIASAAGVWALYIDGTLGPGVSADTIYSSPADANWLASQPYAWTVGNTIDLLSGDFGFGTTDTAAATVDNPFPVKKRGTIDEICVWDGTAVTPTRIAAHALAAVTGWDGDDTGTRVGRFLDAINWPSALRDIDTGISILGPASWSAGTSALSVLQGWAATELGAFYMSKDGKVVWRNRHFPLLDTTATTSQATFGDHHSSATLKYDMDGFSTPRDAQLIHNPVTASRQGGVSVTVKDQTLIDDKYGENNWTSAVTEDQLDSAVRDRAVWLLGRYKELGTRLASMQISPRRDPTNLWPEVLGRELGERITVQRTPLGQNAQIDIDVIIESIEHVFSPKQWTTTFVGSPVDPNVGTYLILDDAVYGLLDTGVLAY